METRGTHTNIAWYHQPPSGANFIPSSRQWLTLPTSMQTHLQVKCKNWLRKHAPCKVLSASSKLIGCCEHYDSKCSLGWKFLKLRDPTFGGSVSLRNAFKGKSEAICSPKVLCCRWVRRGCFRFWDADVEWLHYCPSLLGLHLLKWLMQSWRQEACNPDQCHEGWLPWWPTTARLALSPKPRTLRLMHMHP